MEKTLAAATQWAKNNGFCAYRYGWAFKGAEIENITRDKALEMLASGNWDFGKGFYELSWIRLEGQSCLEFNELSENDMW